MGPSTTSPRRLVGLRAFHCPPTMSWPRGAGTLMVEPTREGENRRPSLGPFFVTAMLAIRDEIARHREGRGRGRDEPAALRAPHRGGTSSAGTGTAPIPAKQGLLSPGRLPGRQVLAAGQPGSTTPMATAILVCTCPPVEEIHGGGGNRERHARQAKLRCRCPRQACENFRALISVKARETLTITLRVATTFYERDRSFMRRILAATATGMVIIAPPRPRSG